MGDESQIIRNIASEKLAEIVTTDHSFFSLQIAKEYHFDPEVRMRCRRAINYYAGNIKPTNSKILPWIDCLPSNWENRSDYLDYIYESVGRPNYWVVQNQIKEEETKFSEVTISLIKELLDKGWERKDIIRLLDLMMENEKIWRRDGGGSRNSPPPLNEFKDFK